MQELVTEKVEQPNFILRFKRPVHPGSNRFLIMIHGWTGDENVMWIFAHSMPSDFWILAPRGPITAPEGGFGWAKVVPGRSPSLREYETAASALLEKIDGWCSQMNIQPDMYSLMGFSQGAIMAYATSLLYPRRVNAVAALAGYLPAGWLDNQVGGSLKGKRFYVAHGRQDETVPVDWARNTVKALELNGAEVNYCESDAGHRLSMSCLHGLEEFFSPVNGREPGK